jgi:ring-1,2-phenylacetyl-CoA epoxidase subunit PaaE
MSQYFFLKVKYVVKETDNAVTIIFDKPTTNVTYKSGQFLTFILDIEGEKIRRSYSLCSSPYTDQDWAVSVKRVEGGKMSNWLIDKIQAGDVIEVMAPAGIFTYEPQAANATDLVLVGGGSGITPLISIIKTALSQEQQSRVFLLYTNRNENSVIQQKELEKLQAAYPQQFFCSYVYTQPLAKPAGIWGRLNQYSIKDLLQTFPGIRFDTALFFVCGPQALMDESFQALDALHVPHNNVRKESFYSAAHTHTDHSPAAASASGGGDVLVNIKYNKHEYKVKVAPGQTILEAALDQDIDLPYSCQSGMCTACMGKCKSGKVEMDEPDGLSENEIRQGFVLTCVGKPLTEDVLIEID